MMKVRYICIFLAIIILIFLIGYALSFIFVHERSLSKEITAIIILLIVIDVTLLALSSFIYKNEKLKKELGKVNKQLERSLFLHQAHASED